MGTDPTSVIMAYVNLQAQEGTVGGVKKLLAELVALDVFYSFVTHIATYTVLKIIIAVLLQEIGKYSQ